MLWCHNFVAIIGASVELFTDERKKPHGITSSRKRNENDLQCLPRASMFECNIQLQVAGTRPTSLSNTE